MPRYPDLGEAAASLRAAGSTHRRRKAKTPARYPLHIGDTYLEPAKGCRMEDLSVEQHPGMHRYAPVSGLAGLRDALSAQCSSRTGQPTERGQILLTAGATGGLMAAIGAITNPGDEVIVPAPFWPLIKGIISGCHAVPVIVPCLDVFDDPTALARTIEGACNSKTAAIYVNTPNNPTGAVLHREHLEAIVSVAQKRGAWLISDEVYEDYVYQGEHVPLRSLAPDRTLSVHSFSKAYGMAGNRVGYVTGPADIIQVVRKVSAHVFYSACHAGQIAALTALESADIWLEHARTAYRAAGDAAARRLGIPSAPSGTFLFVPTGDTSAEVLVDRCAQEGLLVAPGSAFGPYPNHVRVCFTCAPPADVEAGVSILAAALS